MAKLIRDKIPEIIKAQGGDPHYHVARPEEFWQAVLAKFQEETAEFLENPNEAELSDILELLDVIVVLMDKERVQWMRDEKARLRGTFTQKYILDNG